MHIELGRVEAIFRYPVKSMRGEPLEEATLGWYGLDGDRRFAFRRLDHRGVFPWLSASKLPELIQFTPKRLEGSNADAPPTHVVTSKGEELPLFGEALAAEVGRRYGGPVELMQLKHGTFDEDAISVITSETALEICRLARTKPDIRRFRPNIVVRTTSAVPFEEDEWVGGVLTFGTVSPAPAVAITRRDERCMMVNLDPDGGRSTPDVMKAVTRANQNHAGIYGSVTRIGRLTVGQNVVLHR